MYDEYIMLGIVLLSFFLCFIPMVKGSDQLARILSIQNPTEERVRPTLKKCRRFMALGWGLSVVLFVGSLLYNFFWPVTLGAFGAMFIGYGYLCDFSDDVHALQCKINRSLPTATP